MLGLGARGRVIRVEPGLAANRADTRSRIVESELVPGVVVGAGSLLLLGGFRRIARGIYHRYADDGKFEILLPLDIEIGRRVRRMKPLAHLNRVFAGFSGGRNRDLPVQSRVPAIGIRMCPATAVLDDLPVENRWQGRGAWLVQFRSD